MAHVLVESVRVTSAVHQLVERVNGSRLCGTIRRCRPCRVFLRPCERCQSDGVCSRSAVDHCHHHQVRQAVACCQRELHSLSRIGGRLTTVLCRRPPCNCPPSHQLPHVTGPTAQHIALEPSVDQKNETPPSCHIARLVCSRSGGRVHLWRSLRRRWSAASASRPSPSLRQSPLPTATAATERPSPFGERVAWPLPIPRPVVVLVHVFEKLSHKPCHYEECDS